MSLSVLRLVFALAVTGGYLPLRVAQAGGRPIEWHAGLEAVGGAALIVLGTGLASWSIAVITRWGRCEPGVLGPRPTRLVIQGPYGWVRNPFALGIACILAGEIALAPSLALVLYAAGCAAAGHLHVVLRDEPRLAGMFGRAYQAYGAAVPRWIPRPPAVD